MNKLGVKLKKERERKNYSQEYVAERMGVSTSTISRIESNCRNVKMGQIEDYCAVLDISVEQLFASDANPLQKMYSLNFEIKVSSMEELGKIYNFLSSFNYKPTK